MPATVSDDPLVALCVFSDGSAARFRLDDLPCRRLVRDLLAGLLELIHPHGTVNAAGSALHYVQSIRHLVRHLVARGFTGWGRRFEQTDDGRVLDGCVGPERGVHPATAARVPGRRRAGGCSAGGASGWARVQSPAQSSPVAALPGSRLAEADTHLPVDRRRRVARHRAALAGGRAGSLSTQTRVDGGESALAAGGHRPGRDRRIR